jgi:ribosomal protein L11 methyltransferase
MAAARLFPARILASDIDAVAVEVAQANLAANDLSGCIDCIEAAGFDHPALAAEAPYDLIFANILKGPLIALAPDLARHAAPRGFAILSGILNEQADAVQKVYVAEGYNPVASERIGDWTTLVLQKMA